MYPPPHPATLAEVSFRCKYDNLTCREDDAGKSAQEPPAGEGGDGGEGGRGETHHHVGQGHVAHKQVDPCLHSSSLETQHRQNIYTITNTIMVRV